MTMVKHRSSSASPQELTRAMDRLEHALKRLPREFEYVLHPKKHLFITYVRGIVYGLGAITAVAVLIPIIAWMLHSVAWVPLIGDFVSKVATRVENVQQAR